MNALQYGPPRFRKASELPPRAAPPKQAEVVVVPANGPRVVAMPATPRKAPESSPVQNTVSLRALKPRIVAALNRPRAPPAPSVSARTAHLLPAGALPPARIPLEALASPPRDRLVGVAIGVSLLVHAVALTIHFRPFDLRHTSDKGPPLEVALVNARTQAKPTKADVLAQANLDGGGNTDAPRRAKTPLPVLPRSNPEQQVTIATQSVEKLHQDAQELMTQLRSVPVAPVQPKPTEATEPAELPTASELMQRTLEALRLEAQIAKDLEVYQQRPKRRFVGARAEEYRFARYVEDWRLKIERVGNLNYPEAARQQRVYGSLLLTVSIRSDGSVENVEVNRTSGSRLLDAAATKIVEMSGPFALFPPDIRRDTDILHITRTWTFTKGDALVAN